jgi:hypothetical protein
MPADARSGAVFERVVVGPDYFVKQVSFASGWLMRASGDRACRQYLGWQAGFMDQSADSADHAVVAMGLDGAGDDAVLTTVMRDIGGFLDPPGDAMVPAGRHAGFIAHMAALHGTFSGWADKVGLTTIARRVGPFAPGTITAELTAAEVPAVAAAAAAGWAALPGRSPLLWQLARLVRDRPEVITEPLSRMPRTFLPAAGRWATSALIRTGGPSCWAGLPGAGPACWDLCWYLALKGRRLQAADMLAGASARWMWLPRWGCQRRWRHRGTGPGGRMAAPGLAGGAASLWFQGATGTGNGRCARESGRVPGPGRRPRCGWPRRACPGCG